MYKIKTLNKIAKEGLDLLTQDYQIVDEDQADGIILRSFKMQGYDIHKDVYAVARAGAGVNNIPVEDYAKKGIVVFNTPGANANGVKELVIAGLLMASRDLVGGLEFSKTLVDKGAEVPKLVEAGKGAYGGVEIKGKTLGVIGLGAIGVLVANAAEDLGMKVLGFDPYISVDAAWGLSRKITKATSVEEVYAKCDYITIHVPLLPGTKGMINAETLAMMEDGVKILNFSRDALVNDDDIQVALESGKVAKYVTDFPNEKTIGMKNVIAIPHLGASTEESETNCAMMAAEQLRVFMEAGNIINSVNYPNCDLGVLTSPARIAINHLNVKNMVGQISSILGDHNFNIADMLNKSKGDYAYTLIDVEATITDDVVQALKAIDGVIRVRVIQ